MDEFQNVFSHGLSSGFAGQSHYEQVDRAGFIMTSIHSEDAAGNVYHDEYTGTVRAGGQELIRVGNKQETRVYVGGVIDEDKLNQLEISKENVIEFLKQVIKGHTNDIRYKTSTKSDITSGDWSYSYVVIDRDDEIDCTISKEMIKYKGTVVFIHRFLISPIEG
jgi:hypothetical protein